jgi:histidinol-phosphate/aromatic aminotransferase/cobyric acid decarboxylase-like protein/imidazoleglycerol phosphate dehydratase HisB
LRAIAPAFKPYSFASPSDEVAQRAGIDPSQVLRFDQNTPSQPLASTRPAAVAGALARISGYPAGGYRTLRRAIADYAGVEPENVVLGAGADDLILLCARAYAGPGDTVAIPEAPTYPLFRIAVELAGAHVGDDDPVLTFACRPNNPTGTLGPLPDARPLVVDEAYFEFSGQTALPLIDDGVIVLRTFSKLFALAGARIGYALASTDVAAELNARQAPAPISDLSAALAIAALASRPDPGPVLEERERFAEGFRALGFAPLESHANFLYIPTDDADAIVESLLKQGIVVRSFPGAFRVSVLDREDDDRLLEALGGPAVTGGRSVRRVRATAETRFSTRLSLDGQRRVRVATGAGIYDHFLEQLGFHAGFDLVLEGAGDLETGDHHTAEDAALALGEALDAALGDRAGIARYGNAVVPMDDLGGRPYAELQLEHDPGMAVHMFTSLAQAARATIHVEASGRDAHHVAEAAFKAVGRALAIAVAPAGTGIPSTKGIL